MTRKIIFLALVTLCSCKDTKDTQSSRSLTITQNASGCMDPAEYGAVAGDDLDDRAGLQATLDATPERGTICLREGKYLVTRKGGTAADKLLSLHIQKSVTIQGAGRSTVVEMMGDGGGANGNWQMVRIGPLTSNQPDVVDVEISNLTLSGASAKGTGEQTHLVQLGTRAQRVSIHHVWFWHPQRMIDADGDGVQDKKPRDKNGDGVQDVDPVTGEPIWVPAWEGGGDCIRFVGDPEKYISQVSINNNMFIDCDRSGVSIQRAVTGILIENNVFSQVGDQHIDEEPSGAGGIDDLIIKGNLFLGGRQGDAHISLTGQEPPYFSSGHVVEGNILRGRGIIMYQVRGVRLVNNQISGAPTTGALIEAIKAQDEILIAGNLITRTGASTGPVIQMTCRSSGCPSNVSVVNNSIANESNGNLIDIDSLQGASFTGNTFRYSGSTADTYSAINLRSAIRDMDRIVVGGNMAYGPLHSFLKLTAGPRTVGSVTVTGNQTSGVKFGLFCQGAGGFSKKLIHSAYNYDAATAAQSGCTNIETQYP